MIAKEGELIPVGTAFLRVKRCEKGELEYELVDISRKIAAKMRAERRKNRRNSLTRRHKEA